MFLTAGHDSEINKRFSKKNSYKNKIIEFPLWYNGKESN